MSDRMAVYRAYDMAAVLLYVGVTKNFGLRWQRHAERAPWWPLAVRMTVDWYDEEAAAVRAEQYDIEHEHPAYNVATTNGHYRAKRSSGTAQKYMGTAEIARELRLSRQRVNQLTAEPDFPAPFQVLAAGKVWSREAVEKGARAHGRLADDA